MRVSPLGPATNRFARRFAINFGEIAAYTRAAVIPPSIPFSPPAFARDALMVCPRAALPAGLMGGAGEAQTDTGRVFLANITGGPINPGPIEFDLMVLGGILSRPMLSPRFAIFRTGVSGPLGASVSSIELTHGVIGPESVAETAFSIAGSATVLSPEPGDILVASPRAALPAGLALSHARSPGAGQGAVGLANLTAGPVTPGAIRWDIAVFRRPLGRSRAGKMRRAIGLALEPVSLAAKSVSETPIDLRGARVGDAVHAIWEGPDTSIVASHARVSANDTVQFGLANLSSAPLSPPAAIAAATPFAPLGADP